MKKLRNMALPKKALLFLLCALVPLSGGLAVVLLAKPTLAASAPGTPQYYNDRWEEAKIAAGWLEANGSTITNPGPWKMDTGLTPWDGAASTNPANTTTTTDRGGATITVRAVSTAAELRYCVTNHVSFKLTNDIDLNGQLGKLWATPTASTAVWVADGDGHTIYNYYLSVTAGGQSFFGNTSNVTIKNLRMSNARQTVGPTVTTYRQALMINTGSGVHILNCAIEDSIGDAYSHIFGFCIDLGANTLLDGCYTKNLHLYTKGISGQLWSCTASLGGIFQGNNTLIQNCFSVEGSVISAKGHSGAFTSCNGGSGATGTGSTFRNCFTNVDMYGETDTGAFNGVIHLGTQAMENCYSSGKVEGTSSIGGFTAGCGEGSGVGASPVAIRRCYSTAMAGGLSGGARLGSFLSGKIAQNMPGNMVPAYTIQDCYAAGETGSFDTPVAAGTVGGFAGDMSTSGTFGKGTASFSNCFYDKQTTAMREWASGQSISVAGITGVLTTDATKNSTLLTGLTSPSGSNGFTGFTDDSQWVFEPDHYPQLKVFADTATIEANFTNTNWMTRGELTNLIKAYSRASTSTVKLETWETGYDGVTPLGPNVYDTVRDVMLDFGMTQGADTAWRRVGNGPTLANGTGNTTEINGVSLPVLRLTPSGGIYGGQYRARELQPGVEWLRVNAKVGTQVGTRALRVVPTSGLAAGPNAALVRGVVDTYDHRDGVRLSYSTGPDMAAIPPLPIKEMVFKSTTTDFINIDVPTLLQLEHGNPPIPPGKLHVRVSPLEGYHPNGDPILGTPLALTNTATDPLSKQLNGETPVLITGRYVVEYFWVMSDGRYMRGQKLMDLSSAIKNARVSEDGGDTWLDWDNGLEDEPVTVRAGDWIEYEIAVDYAGRDVPARVIDERVFSPQTTE